MTPWQTLSTEGALEQPLSGAGVGIETRQSASSHAAGDCYFISKVTDNTSKCDTEQERNLTQAVNAVYYPGSNILNTVTFLQSEEKMQSSFSHATATASEHGLSEPPSLLYGHREPEGCPQSVSDPLTYCVRSAGVLRYNRESDSQRTDLAAILSAPLTDYPVKCEYCGEKAKPSLDLTWLQQSETVPLFCCGQWQQLCEMLVKHECDLKMCNPTLLGYEADEETENLLFKGREMEDHNKSIRHSPHRLGENSEPEIYEEYSIQLPVAKSFAPTSKVLSFRLSGSPKKDCMTVCSSFAAEKHLKTTEEEEQVLVPFCDHKSLQFGICHLQDGTEILQKNYSTGLKFLTLFRDGSAQVFYPSGLLALVVVVTGENGRVCIVYDDSNAPKRPVRAIFQSDGKATCYHSNGNIWLSLNRSGGQCLNEEGTRVRRWSWSSCSFTPSPLHPLFLSLNKTVGVRVLGREKVFVSFFAKGQQAKFSVGPCPCCCQGECKPDEAASEPSVLKEELFVLAARIRIQLALQHLQHYLTTPSHPRLPKITQTLRLHVAAQRLLAVTANVTMSESDKAFIHRCLRDCV